ncbi:MAG: glycoside hydrolase family 16 protein [Acidobacteriaceae bacterium]
MKLQKLSALLCAMLIVSPAVAAAQQNIGGSHTRAEKLVWSDEFNGSHLDPGKWIAVNNDSGYGNNELEYYTSRAVNVKQRKGELLLTARREKYTGKDGQTRLYTSGRIETRGRFQLKYGRIEARIKMPKGQGIWSAFWMLGSDYARVGWPNCGELDIMENVGFEPSKVHGSLHGPGYSGSNPLTGAYTLPGGKRFSDGYHVFSADWSPHAIRFYVDGVLYETQTAKDVPAGHRWVFNHPFYIILNVAVGGFWPGNPDATTKFPQTMRVDYVRVYQLANDPAGKGKN